MNMWSKTAVEVPGSVLAKAGRAEIILDLSRLLSRLLHPTPTGVDRVEMAYARGLLASVPDRLSFAAFNPVGIYGRLERNAVVDFLDQTEAMWDGNRRMGKMGLRINAARTLLKLMPKRAGAKPIGVNNVYLLASPSNLHKPERIGKTLVREQARFICLVHDLIPIQFPEYARETGASLHRVRMDTVGHHASAVIAYSHATADALRAYLDDHCSAPPIRIAPLGANTRSVLPAEQLKDHPYFVFLGTIEPRKNHLLLLNVWRRLVEETKDGNAPIPKLVLIGRRGWENENIVDMLDRCPALKDHVIEASRLSDPDAQDLMRQACALVLPSFVEGFGLPIAEALEMGVPVLCSDIPAHREVGGAVPEFIDPLDGPGWLRAIRDYAAPGSWRRRAQVKRMAEWSRPSWDDHIKAVIETCDLVATKG